jgi:hypothetical protein
VPSLTERDLRILTQLRDLFGAELLFIVELKPEPKPGGDGD